MVQLDNKEIMKITQRVQGVRQGLVQKVPFYALLLFGLRFSLDDTVERVYTDGERIAFHPVFLNSISDRELEFIMLHEVSHVALGHPFRNQAEYDLEVFDQACDIVVNSNIYHYMGNKEEFITIRGIGVMPHKTCDGEEGYKYTVEQVYEKLLKRKSEEEKGERQNGADVFSVMKSEGAALNGDVSREGGHKTFDDHSFWMGNDDKGMKQQIWNQRVIDAAHTVMQTSSISIKNRSKSFGGVPIFAERILKETTNGKLDWKTLLNAFVQEEINDYSFAPPDRRFQESDFFLPDFNEKTEKVKNVWFVVDTSGSISDDMIMDAYNEIVSAIEIFGGNIQSYLSFTESFITKPAPFSAIHDLLAIKPVGGGGNNFSLIFKYLETGEGIELKDENDQIISCEEIIEPSCIVIITDGYDEFPPQEAARGLPVLWIINNDDPAATPPWGMVARIPQKNKDDR